VVEGVPVGGAPAVDLDDAAILDDERRFRVVGTVHRDEPELGERLDQDLAPELAILALPEPLRPQGALAAHTRRRPRGRTRQSVVPPTTRVAAPTPRALPRPTARDGVRCRSRGWCPQGSMRAPRRAGGCRRAASSPPRGPPRPEGGACPGLRGAPRSRGRPSPGAARRAEFRPASARGRGGAPRADSRCSARSPRENGNRARPAREAPGRIGLTAPSRPGCRSYRNGPWRIGTT